MAHPTKAFLQFSLLVTTTLVTPFFLFGSTEAATLSLSPSTSKISEGGTFTVSVSVNTQGKAINNAEARVTFPNDLIEVTSINSGSSIFSLWAEQPSFSNASGAVTFNGGAVNPGYTGAGGRIFVITFKAKHAGTANLALTGAAVRENDGLGTDILTGRNNASIEITGKAAPVVKPTVPKKEVPVPVITPPVTPAPVAPPVPTPDVILYSLTNPDQTAWYPLKTADIAWKIPAEAQAIQVSITDKPDTTPNDTVPKNNTQQVLSGLTDGTHYFNIRYRINSTWSKVAHYTINIDQQPPRDVTATLSKNNLNESNLILKATDTLAGLDYYELTIDALPTTRVAYTAPDQTVTLPTLGLGKHAIVLAAFDKAGNKTNYNTTIQIDPTIAPQITNFTPSINHGQQISVQGRTSYPTTPVSVVMKSVYGNVSTYSITTDAQGNFAFLSEPVQNDGSFEVFAFITTEQGVKGPASQTVKVEVVPAPAGFSLSSVHIPAVPAIALTIFALMAFLNLFGLYKFFSLKRRYNRMEAQSHKVFELLVLRANRQIAILEDAEKIHGLNPTEKNALDDLKDVMAQLEHFDTPTK